MNEKPTLLKWRNTDFRIRKSFGTLKHKLKISILLIIKRKVTKSKSQTWIVFAIILLSFLYIQKINLPSLKNKKLPLLKRWGRRILKIWNGKPKKNWCLMLCKCKQRASGQISIILNTESMLMLCYLRQF